MASTEYEPKQFVELEPGVVPEGYEVVRVGLARDGELYVFKRGVVTECHHPGHTTEVSIIVRKIHEALALELPPYKRWQDACWEVRR